MTYLPLFLPSVLPPAFLPASYPPCLLSFFLSFLDRISCSFCFHIPNARFIGINHHARLSLHTNTKHIGHPGCVHTFLSGNSALGTCFTLGTRAMTVATWVRSPPCVWNWRKHKNMHPKKYFLLLYFTIVLDSQEIQGKTESLHIPHLKLSYIAFVILQ